VEQNPKFSNLCPDIPEGEVEMINDPYRELFGKSLYLSIATRPNIAYAVGILCRFVKNPGSELRGAAILLLPMALNSSIHILLLLIAS